MSVKLLVFHALEHFFLLEEIISLEIFLYFFVYFDSNLTRTQILTKATVAPPNLN